MGMEGGWVVNKRIALNVGLIAEILVQTLWFRKSCEEKKSKLNPIL